MQTPNRRALNVRTPTRRTPGLQTPPCGFPWKFGATQEGCTGLKLGSNCSPEHPQATASVNKYLP